jgi:Kef-type K+ transport system membrane component KefB
LRKYKIALAYIVTITAFVALMYMIFFLGKGLESGRILTKTALDTNSLSQFLLGLWHNIQSPLALLLAQIITIIIVARILGWLSLKIGQPAVIGEIVAGILLGPSFAGAFLPAFSTALFPVQSLGNLQFLSQIGLILFMFIVGMELDFKTLKNRAEDAVLISHMSIILPFTLGLALAFFIYNSFAPEGISFLSFGLFMGVAMSITAFPVLARIVHERGIQKTPLGVIAITCAAIDDVTAWCLLAAVVAVAKAGSLLSTVFTLLVAILYILVMLKVIKPFLNRVGDLHPSRENLSKPVIAIFLLTLIISSYFTEVIGLHALFGAFVAGTIMPDNVRFKNLLIEKIEDVAVVLLLPLFFVFTGLRTQVGLINDFNLLGITVLIILVAITGKFVGGALAARFVGQSWQQSLSIGALMNTRGLMELVVLNIGYDLGILSPEIFSMMVIMALVTTFMTGPALNLINRLFDKKQSAVQTEIRQLSKYKVMVAFAKPEKGIILLRLAHSFVKKMSDNALVTVLHLTPNKELSQEQVDEYEHDSFAPVISEAKMLDQKITSLFKVSNDIMSDIPEVANKGDYDLLLLGIGQSIYEGSMLGRFLGFTTRIIGPERVHAKKAQDKWFEKLPFEESTRLVLSRSEVPVGILLDKNLAKTDNVFIPIFESGDAFLIRYAQKLISNSGSQVTLFDVAGIIRDTEIKEIIRAIEHNAPNHINLLLEQEFDSAMLQNQDLVMISIASWKKLFDDHSNWLSAFPSVLIIFEPANDNSQKVGEIKSLNRN